jgi:hypothetical protein
MSRAFAENWEVKMKEKMATPKHAKMIEYVPLSAIPAKFRYRPKNTPFEKDNQPLISGN